MGFRHFSVLGAPDLYENVQKRFIWPDSTDFNIAALCCDRHAAALPDAPAIIEVGAGFTPHILTYGQLRQKADQLAQGLVQAGIKAGDRIAILLPQSAFVAISHIAIYKIGAIALPLAALFGAEALLYRLEDAAARVVITDSAGVKKLRALPAGAHQPELVISIDGEEGQALSWHRFIEGMAPFFATRPSLGEDPALMIYTSGTTGKPKGALHAQRVLLGHLPGVEMAYEFAPQNGDRFWTPADWAWAGGLLNILLPGLYYGLPVTAWAFQKFDAEAAFDMIRTFDIRNAFIPPTALRMMRMAGPPKQRYRLPLRAIGSGGEALGTPTFDWGREALGLPINEFYGQTECNFVLASCEAMKVRRAGMIGKAVPGHRVVVIRSDGQRAEVGETGQIAILRPDPVMFLGYWRNQEATQDKFIGDYMTTGDQGVMDEEGYIGFIGRDDDVITSSGFRIGPVEIEDCLIKHQAVALAAVVGKPDALRTEIVTAFITLRNGVAPSEALAEELRLFVREKLSAHEYPREIHFIEEMPLTTTGKIIRRVLRDKFKF